MDVIVYFFTVLAILGASLIPAHWLSVTAHELGHALAGKCCGLKILSIDTSLTRAACYFVEDEACAQLEYRPLARLIISAAGAVANVLVIVACLALEAFEVLPPSLVLTGFLWTCAMVNAFAVTLVMLPSADPNQDSSRCREAILDLWHGRNSTHA